MSEIEQDALNQLSAREELKPYTEAVLLAHLRRIVIEEILAKLPADEANRVISMAVQRLVQYLDEGPVQSIAPSASAEQFRAAIDRVIKQLRATQTRCL